MISQGPKPKKDEMGNSLERFYQQEVERLQEPFQRFLKDHCRQGAHDFEFVHVVCSMFLVHLRLYRITYPLSAYEVVTRLLQQNGFQVELFTGTGVQRYMYEYARGLKVVRAP